MPSDIVRHDHHHHAHAHSGKRHHEPCCGGGTSGESIESSASVPASGRSFQISGLDCAEEVAVLNKVVGPELGGREHLIFDVINGRMTVLDSAAPVTDDRIIALVASTGMTAKAWEAKHAAADRVAHLAKQRRFTMLSGGFWTAGFVWHIVETGVSGAISLFSGHGEAPIPLPEAALFACAILFGVWLVAPKAWSSARRLSPDMNLLMIVAVAGALALGEFFEAATVAFFFALSLYLESWSVGRARNAISALLDIAPPTARVIRPDGSEDVVRAELVAIGENFLVRGGDRIPLDGEVTEGAGAVDQAPITGESALVPKEPGDEVYAGTINGEGTLIIRATKAASDTVLSRIIRMVSDAQSRRAEVEQWVSRFARVYTPAVMGLAIAIAAVPPLFAGGWDFWFYNALVLLVIACPCALVISTPVSIVAALAASARAGVLIKGGAYVEAPGRTTALAMDKTGTITLGRPEVAAIHVLDSSVNESDLLARAASLEVRSSHPLARAIVDRASKWDTPVAAAQDTRIVAGRGIEGRVGAQSVWLGSERFAGEKGFAGGIPSELRTRIEEAGNTLVVVGDEGGIMGVLELRDRIRPDAQAIVSALHSQGVRTIVMLTGDNERTARAVAAEVGIDEVRAQLLPEDKVTAIEELAARHDVVAMIGDGVNDAPAMARAHYGIAMGAMGSDAAIETADIALMTDDLGKVPWLIAHSRRTMTIIRQNIGISLLTKATFVGLTAFGMATMWGAIAADVGVSLLVVANALRLLNAAGRKAPPAGGETVGEHVVKGALAHGH